MDLFNGFVQQPINLIHQDGVVDYFGEILSPAEAEQYYNSLLMNIHWQQDQAVVMGKKITTKRKVAWHGDRAFNYTYSKTTKVAEPWTSELLELKYLIEVTTNESYNSCLLNLYHNGNEGMAWHSDGEKDLKKHGAIASLSLGAERNFSFKHKKSKERITVSLKPGSLIVMKGQTQEHWLHRLPPTTKVHSPRINLTFRTIIKI